MEEVLGIDGRFHLPQAREVRPVVGVLPIAELWVDVVLRAKAIARWTSAVLSTSTIPEGRIRSNLGWYSLWEIG